MKIQTKALTLLAASLLLQVQQQGSAQQETPQAEQQGSVHQAGDVLPLTPARHLRFDEHEGTWVSLDVSPDGQTILFELLGDLYQMPVRGGEARCIVCGLPFDSQPTYSLDGSMIAFISDRSGNDNLWIANSDGSHPAPSLHPHRQQRLHLTRLVFRRQVHLRLALQPRHQRLPTLPLLPRRFTLRATHLRQGLAHYPHALPLHRSRSRSLARRLLSLLRSQDRPRLRRRQRLPPLAHRSPRSSHRPGRHRRHQRRQRLPPNALT